MRRSTRAKIQITAPKLPSSDNPQRKPRIREVLVEPMAYDDDRAVSKFGALPPAIENFLFFDRSYRTILSALIKDQGGPSPLPEARRQLIRRLAAGCAFAEQMEARFSDGENISSGEYAALCVALVRLAHLLGLEPKVNNPTTKLSDYLRPQTME